MIKQLQLYTICIVIVVIVLSQFSFQKETYVSKVSNTTEDKATQSNSVLDSKYAEPVREVLNVIDNTKNSVDKAKMEMNRLKKFLDIEASIKELNKMME